MKPRKYYISSFTGSSGVCKYSYDFYRLVLSGLDYEHVDSDLSYAEILSKVASRDEVHVELGIFQRKEVELVMRMVKAGYKNVSVTLHDPPLVKYPYYESDVPLFDKAFRFYDVSWDNFASMMPVVQKLKRIYVLSKKGVTLVRNKYHVNRVSYLPHVVAPDEIISATYGNDLFFMGFIGPNKGLDYALKIHQKLNLTYPELGFVFNIVGEAIGKSQLYVEQLMEQFKEHVCFHGYVPDNQLVNVLSTSGYAILPFKDYSFYHPFSGSVLQAMKMGKVVFSHEVNAVGELIQHGVTGFMLDGNISRDTRLLAHVMSDQSIVKRVTDSAQNLLLTIHNPSNVRLHFLHENMNDFSGVLGGKNI